MTASFRIFDRSATQYAAVALLFLCATALRAVVHPWVGPRIAFALYLPVILAAAWAWGVGPGILALILSEIGVWLFLRPEVGFTIPTEGDWFMLGLFLPVGAFLIFAADVARRARRDAEAEKIELDQALAAARMGHWTWDLSSGRVARSDNLGAIYGLPAGSLGGELPPFLSVVHPDDAPRVKEIIDRAVREGADYDIDFRIGSRDSVQWIRERGHPVRERGRVVRVTGLATNVTERREAEEARRYLAAIVSSSEDAIISVDLEGRILSWNAAAERLFGYRAGEMIERSIEVLMAPDRVEDYRGILARIARGERVEHYETVRRRRDGSLVDVSLSVSPVRDEAGRIIAAAKIARDLTALRELQRERERTRELFLATLGHDLRNPLNTITASLFYLRRHVPENVQHVIARMSSSSERMARMVAQLLDFTRARLGGGIPIMPTSGDLLEICKTLVSELELQYPNRLCLTANGDFRGTWDADRLAQVFSNLVVNALDHGSAEEPVAVALSRADGAVRVEVSNGGGPITDAMRESIFEPFRRGSDQARGPTRGLGLGLYITREIVRAHGGAIEIESPPGRVVFRVTLPVVESAEISNRGRPSAISTGR